MSERKLWSRIDKTLTALGFVLLVSLAILTAISVLTGGELHFHVFAQTTDDTSKTAEAVIQQLKERASAQQTMIGTLLTITSLYVVIISAVAYFRLQQIKQDTKEAIDLNSKSLDETLKRLTNRIEDLSDDLRHDVPAVHGIGNRLEELLVQLENKFPVDGELTTQDKYGVLRLENSESIAIDEMVINSLDIFNIKKDVGKVRTISRLFVSLGQYYFLKSTYHHEREQVDLRESCFVRAGLYFEKANQFDTTDAVAWRGRGIWTLWRAQYDKESAEAGVLDPKLIELAQQLLLKCIQIDSKEPGALDGLATCERARNRFREACEYSTRIIENRNDYTPALKRKYGIYAYSNRALDSAVLLASDPSDRERKIQEIIRDYRDGSTFAAQLSVLPGYQQKIESQIRQDSSLTGLYEEHLDFRNAILLILGIAN
jgi:tetratricopeptide (TPR) repeat protein